MIIEELDESAVEQGADPADVEGLGIDFQADCPDGRRVVPGRRGG